MRFHTFRKKQGRARKAGHTAHQKDVKEQNWQNIQRAKLADDYLYMTQTSEIYMYNTYVGNKNESMQSENFNFGRGIKPDKRRTNLPGLSARPPPHSPSALTSKRSLGLRT